MRAELHINGEDYIVYGIGSAGAKGQYLGHESVFSIYQRTNAGAYEGWDGPSEPQTYKNELAALRAGIDYLLDAIESEKENE